LNFNKNINIFLSYSCSKTFSIYGLRLGVLFILTKKSISNDKKISTELLKYTRAIYSNPPTLPISIINKIFSNELYFNTYINELKIHKDTLNERAKIFLNEAKENKLVHCKYLGGFFIFIPCKNSFKIYQKLKKEAVYIAPIDGGIRISLGYLNKNEVKGLAEKIKKAL
jgi:aromatic-amino-acid transaminase